VSFAVDWSASFLLQTVIDAISLGGFYALLALGVALVFGIMRLVNFAYGELIMVSGYALVVFDGAPLGLRLVLVVVATVVFALASERIVFRPLRAASPATLLIGSFALSYFLQNAAGLIFGTLPRSTSVSDGLARSFSVAGLDVSRLDVVTILLAVALLAGLAVLIARTSIGVQMRAAAEDFRTARLMGVRANAVIAAAFALSGILAAAAGVLLVAQTGTVTPTMGASVIVYAFVAVVVGGMGSLSGAAVGGFGLGAASAVLQALLPESLAPYRDAFVFALALATLVARPQGLLPARSAVTRVDAEPAGSPSLSSNAPLPTGLLRRASTLVSLVAGVAVLALLASTGPGSQDLVVVTALVNMVVVVGLSIFVGNSGVFSFGHIAFMAVGAYTTALLTIPSSSKHLLFLAMPDWLADLHMAPVPAILVGGVLAAALAAALALPLMRLSGLNAALATFAVLLITYSVASNLDEVTNGASGLGGIPKPVGIPGALVAALGAIALAFLFGLTRIARQLRASREDETAARAIGISIVRNRAIAFTVSAFVVGIAGGLSAGAVGSIQPDAFYLSITFLTIAMLVVGGMTSLSGAVVGTVVLSVVAELLRRLEDGAHVGFFSVDAPTGMREIGLAVCMLAILILRPSGLTGGREVTLPIRRRDRDGGEDGSADQTAVAAAAGGGRPET
jgi:branched-subunit amino acid ABC-type transport system permease component